MKLQSRSILIAIVCSSLFGLSLCHSLNRDALSAECGERMDGGHENAALKLASRDSDGPHDRDSGGKGAGPRGVAMVGWTGDKEDRAGGGKGGGPRRQFQVQFSRRSLDSMELALIEA